jgi:hypothetical protein
MSEERQDMRTAQQPMDGKPIAVMHQPMSFKGRRQSGVKCEDSEDQGQ